jgi:hypothetical protein
MTGACEVPNDNEKIGDFGSFLVGKAVVRVCLVRLLSKETDVVRRAILNGRFCFIILPVYRYVVARLPVLQ